LLDSNSRRLSNELDEAKRKLSKETADRSRLNDQRAALQRDNDNLKSDRDSMERRTRDAERLVRDLRAQLEDVQGRFDDEKRARVKAADDSRDLRKLLLGRETANAELLGKITTNNEAEKDALEDEIAELQEKNKQLSTRIVDLESKLDA